MWKHFMKSIGLLAIALLAALYSSGAGREGRVLAAGGSAILALGIAVWVGIRFVPRLASHVDWDWLPFFSRYRVMREGWIYLAAVTVVVFAAINTANNLLYMVLSALLAVLALSGFLSALNFRLLRMVVRLPSHCFAGEPFPISIQAHNDKLVFPSFSIHVDALERSPFQFSTFYYPVIGKTRATSQTGQAILKRRGRFSMGKVRVSSRYPFGFFSKERSYAVDATCTCYPELIPADQMNISTLDLTGANPRFERGLGHDLYMIRDYIPSDSARHVHWKASAKTSTLKTREYAAEESRRVVLAFDRYGQPWDLEEFEHQVSFAASLVYHLIHDGVEVSFISDEWRSIPGNAQNVLESILDYLALVQMTGTVNAPQHTGGYSLSIRRQRRA
jgi:uncharacterized protein (DUF58 family)